MYNYTGLNAPQNTSSIWDFLYVKANQESLKKKKKEPWLTRTLRKHTYMSTAPSFSLS